MTRLMRLFVPAVLFAAALLASETIPASDTLLEIDPAHTTVEFSLGAVGHTVHGRFLLKRGSIRFDPVSGKASGELVVDAASGDSGSGSRDHRMHASILQSAMFPEIVFRPDRVEGKVAAGGTSEIQLHVTFSLHGADHEFTMPVQVQQTADNQVTANSHFSLPYVSWGLKNPSTFVLRVSEKVDITIHTVAHPAR